MHGSRSRTRLVTGFLRFCLGLGLVAPAAAELGAQNIVPNPGLEGMQGASVVIDGTLNLVSGFVPDSWRAFAVFNGSSADLEVVPLAADEVFPGSPATNGILLRVNAFGGDQGFDDDNGRFPITPGLRYHGEFYVRSANADDSNQTFHFGFPLFNDAGVYLAMEPGGLAGQTATSDWQLVTGATFEPRSPVAQGHISWRCVGDGGEDAILIAFPSVTSEGVVTFPTGLTCRRERLDVDLAWTNHQAYDSLRLLRDAAELAVLDPAATSYRDVDVPDGVHSYQLLASFGGNEDGPTCEIAVFRLAPGTEVSVDLGDVDVESGLGNIRPEGSDGETAFTICGPEDDLREGRSNLGADDPTPDAPDAFFYFNVTDPAMKAQSGYRLEATVHDDPARAGASLNLQYTNADSIGPADIPNTFFGGSPEHFLAGTGDWVVHTWEITNAGFRSFQQGIADFRLGVNDGGRVCLDRVDLTFFPFPSGLRCRRTGDGVELTWENAGAYTAIKILRDGTQIASLAGDATSHLDPAPPEGVHTYQVVAVAGGLEAGPSCAVTIIIVPPGTRVSVDLGDVDVENGLVNSGRVDGGDGENAFVICGPEGDLREGRSNWGGEDPTPDFGDGIFYFTVVDEAMKAQAVFRLEATVYDDPARAGAGLYLQYTTSDSTGPGDIPNTFFPLEAPPVNFLGGTGAWVVLTWEITNAGFRSFQQGAADFRLGVTDGGRVCLDRVDLVFPEGTEEGVGPFKRGDCNQDETTNLTDGIFLLNFLFLGGPAPVCVAACDNNGSGTLNITVAVYLFNFLFLGGPEPPPPLEACDRSTRPSDVAQGCADPQGCT